MYKEKKKNKYKRLQGFSQKMFNNPTPPEIEMEKILDKLQDLGHIEYYEKQTIMLNMFILDFYLPDRQLCIEVDGKTYHNEIRDKRRDRILLKRAGINTVRIPAYEALYKKGLAKNRLFKALETAVIKRKIPVIKIDTHFLPNISLFCKSNCLTPP